MQELPTNVIQKHTLWKKETTERVVQALKDFKAIAKDHFDRINFFLPRYKFYQQFFTKKHLDNLDWERIQEIGKNIHAFNSNSLAKSRALGRPNHEIDYYADAFHYLKFGKDSIDKKIDNLLDSKGSHALRFFGPSAITELTGYAYPQQYVFQNKRDKDAAELLGIPINYPRGSSHGDKFLLFNQAIAPLLDLYKKHVGLQTNTTIPLEVDQFLSWIYENRERYDRIELSMAEEPTVIAEDAPHYWLFSPGANAKYWEEFYEEGIMGLGWHKIGDLTQYSNKEEMVQAIQEAYDTTSASYNSGLANYEFKEVLKEGDIVIAKKGRKKFLGYGIVESDYYFDEDRKENGSCRRVDWKKKGEWVLPGRTLVMKTLTDITKYPDYVIELKKLLEIGSVEIEEQTQAQEKAPYTIKDALTDLFIKKEDFQEICDALAYKKNIILQGPPGVGKTFVAKRIAKTLMGVDDDNKIEMVQFHQSYSYEDFIQGIRPDGEGSFKTQKGVFYNFCDRARVDEEGKYFMVIDEINRGNLSKIFGELMLLIEHDKRNEKITLTYSENGEKFSIPPNIYIIGTMNTADRSLAMVDYALRRRFAFIDILPSFGSSLKSFLKKQKLSANVIEAITTKVVALNNQIQMDPNLGEGFTIGHSYFCHAAEVKDAKKWYNGIIKNEIAPMLREYWFDDREKANNTIQKLSL